MTENIEESQFSLTLVFLNKEKSAIKLKNKNI